MILVKKGGVAAEIKPASVQAPVGRPFVYRCPHDGAERETPGPCPKCGMTLGEPHKVAKAAPAPAGERRIYVCDLHPESVSDKPGQCFKDS